MGFFFYIIILGNVGDGNKLKNKSAVRFEIGSSSGGKAKGTGSAAKVVESRKAKKSDFAYEYPQVFWCYFVKIWCVLGFEVVWMHLDAEIGVIAWL